MPSFGPSRSEPLFILAYGGKIAAHPEKNAEYVVRQEDERDLVPLRASGSGDHTPPTPCAEPPISLSGSSPRASHGQPWLPLPLFRVSELPLRAKPILLVRRRVKLFWLAEPPQCF